MKKIAPLAICGIALLAAACSESSYEVHQTYFYPQQPYGMKLYADQPSDTIRLISMDSWTISPQADWISVSPSSMDVPANDGSNTRLTVSVEPNTTGKNRRGQFHVSSYDNIGMTVNQYSWLNIIRPSASISQGSQPADINSDFENSTATFSMNIPATVTDTTVIFRVYRDNATLTSDAEWFKPAETTFSAGRHEVDITVQPNGTTASRTATLILTSAGISTPIAVKQAGKAAE